jgi:acid phosphatase class B
LTIPGDKPIDVLIEIDPEIIYAVAGYYDGTKSVSKTNIILDYQKNSYLWHL